MSDTFLSACWENLIMANYEVDQDLLKPYLPNGVEFDSYNNKIYVSLVGFLFTRTSLFNIPVPFMGTFEEVNLRFYVKRVDGDLIKRGVVFINETVPYKMVAWLANKLYKEHYVAIPTKSSIDDTGSTRNIRYEWKIKNQWNHLAVQTFLEKEQMVTGSIEEFIFEHYYGYTRLSEHLSQEYQVNHPRWQISKVLDHSIDCDFESMYGKDFSFLKDQTPEKVIFAEGSPVTVNWKRTTF